jgi:serine-type D-Ala-D-Ala endopeptidase (penicillin-binding protein 7)
MRKSALGVFISLFILACAAPAAQAANSGKASAKKHGHKKSSIKHRAARSTSVAHTSRTTAHRRVAFTPAVPMAPPVLSAGDMAGLNEVRDPLALKSNAALVIDQKTAQVLFEKNSSIPLPIASLTKLMTAMVVVTSHQDMDEVLEVTSDDIDRERNSSSRLRVGSRLTRANMLHIALMSSENRAASALGRHYPGGLPAFVAAMNAEAKVLGMFDTHYVEPTGLSSQNVASARDLSKLVMAAYQEPVIRQYSTDSTYAVNPGGYVLQYMSSNRLVRSSGWDIGLQKTGFINEAGHCLVMQARIENRPVVMVFLDSKGKYSRFADADRVRRWVEMSKPQILTQAMPQS